MTRRQLLDDLYDINLSVDSAKIIADKMDTMTEHQKLSYNREFHFSVFYVYRTYKRIMTFI